MKEKKPNRGGRRPRTEPLAKKKAKAVKKRRSPAELDATAHHEAGHVVIGAILGIPIIGVHISSFDTGTLGACTHASPERIEYKNTREKRRNVRNSITTGYAGVPAQQLVDPSASYAIAGSHDMNNIRQTACVHELVSSLDEIDGDGSDVPCLNRLRRKAKQLVKKHEKSIRHLAKRLLKCRKPKDSQLRMFLSELQLYDS